MDHRFHPDKNIGLDTTEMMKIINEAKDGLEDKLRDIDTSREEECVRAAEDEFSIPSDDNLDSESSDTSSEPALSSSKASTLPAKHTNDNEETTLKKTHPRQWTLKKESFRNNQEVIFQVLRQCKLLTFIHIAFKMD